MAASERSLTTSTQLNESKASSGTESRTSGLAHKLAAASGTLQFFEPEEKVERVQSNIDLARPQTHKLPTYIMWLIVLTIAVGMAAINKFMVFVGSWLMTLKFGWAQQVLTESGLAAGAATLAAMSVLLALAAALLVVFVAPVCAGSGLPEAKGYMNGNEIEGLFGNRQLFVRVIGIVLSTSAGLPVGREGPMVAIGVCLGYGVVHFFGLPYVRSWVKTNASDQDACSPALIVDYERFGHAKRIGAALGGAAGIAVAFNAPIGGILYMFEEVTVTSWAPELTVRAFACTVLATLASKGLLDLSGDEVHTLVMFEDGTEHDITWGWQDVPAFIVLAIAIGLFSALFTRILLKVFVVRRAVFQRITSKTKQTAAKVAELVLFTVLCALMWSFVPALIECEPIATYGSSSSASSARRLGGGSDADASRYTCAEGERNDIAHLLLHGAEGAVKVLYNRANAGDLSLTALTVTFFSFAALACGLPGLPVPMGMFVPSMLLGALMGRFVGEVVQFISPGMASSGVYALVGSASMLGGFTHMTLAIVVLLVEASADLMLIPPLMLSIFIATAVSQKINHHGYDEVLILKKGVPFLDTEPPEEMEDLGALAGDLMDELHSDAILAPNSTLTQVEKALAHFDVLDFPVVRGNACVGITSRHRLEAALAARRMTVLEEAAAAPLQVEEAAASPANVVRKESSQSVGKENSDEDGILDTRSSKRSYEKDYERSHLHAYISNIFKKRRNSCVNEAGEAMLSVHRIMDKAPILLLENTHVARFYPLFTRAGVQIACVVGLHGEFRGVLSRDHLISETRDAHRPEDFQRYASNGGALTRNASTSSLGEAQISRQLEDLQAEVSQLKTELERERQSKRNL